MGAYDFAAIEKKWQEYWEEHETFRARGPGEEGFPGNHVPKMYVLDMFPYPSGAGLHVGHPEGYTATDIVARYMRMRGYNVMHPMGYDAFGLPAEQYAVEHGVHPRITTEQNIANIERQIKMFGFSYDWSRRLSTTDVGYYKWTQWIFLQLFNSWYDAQADRARPIKELEDALAAGKYLIDMNGELVYAGQQDDLEPIFGGGIGLKKWHDLEPLQQRRLIDEYRLAYIDEVPVNWCPALGTVLANEEVTNEGRSERGNHPVYRRPMRQWMLRITAYAERLAADVEQLDWPEPIKIMQRNWIGRSEGAEVDFLIFGGTGFQPASGSTGFQPVEEEMKQWFEERLNEGFPGGTGFQPVSGRTGFQPVAEERVPYPIDEFVRIASLPEDQRPMLGAKTFEGCDPFPEGKPPPDDLLKFIRNLPHVTMQGATYFVTFHLKKDIVLSEEERRLVLQAILHWHGQRCTIYSAVVLDNHAHMIVLPLPGNTLSDLLHSIKGFTARKINELRGRSGSLWQDENFDHVIRDGAWLTRFTYYVCDNPVKKGLAKSFAEYSSLYVNAEEMVTEEGEPFGHRLKACATTAFIRVYTTRPDTLFGATYMVLAPEHPLVEQVMTDDQRAAVTAYVKKSASKSELERTAESKVKTGVFTGGYAINPVTRKPVPIWVADYVLMGYGTGAIMAVPAHDTRDLEFAEQFGLPVIQVVEPPAGRDWRGFVDDGTAINSGPYDGLPTPQFKKKITQDLAEAGLARAAVNYKLRDWLFSRQRYWGEPFPIVHCPRCGLVDLPEDQLPLELPEMEDFSPSISDDPQALPTPPLGKATDWVRIKCPRCGAPAKRELNTMPQWAGSCWYYLRYLDPHNEHRFVSPAKEKYWMKPAAPPAAGQAAMGVDLYVGGAEHAVLHLLYTRFWHKVLFDLGYVSTSEPFGKLFNQGMIRSFAYRDSRSITVGYDDVDIRPDGPYHKKTGEKLNESVEKMSKSLKNVVNPDHVIGEYGADTFRLYEMFMGPLEASKPWNTRDVPGVHRFCQRIWRMVAGSEDQPALVKEGTGNEDLERLLHKTIRKVGQDIEGLRFNTAIAAMMEFVNAVYKAESISRDQAERFLLIVAPFTPHMAEELWQVLGHSQSLAWEKFPQFDPELVRDAMLELPVQVNGKVRARISVAADASEEAVLEAALADEKIAGQLAGKSIIKKVVVPGRMVNFVVK